MEFLEVRLREVKMTGLNEYHTVVIILLFIFFLFFSIISLIPFFILKYIRKRYNLKEKYFSNSKLVLYILIITASIAFYESCTAVFPNNSFYYDEFEYVTNRKIPDSAEIKFKDSSYPDFHGDYFSKSIIELSSKYYDKLLKELEDDKTLIESTENDKNIFKVFERKIPNESDRCLFIRFLKDRKTIIVNADFT